MKLPPLNGLKAFEAAARSGSYVAAADEMNVSPSAISPASSNAPLRHSSFPMEVMLAHR